MHLKRWITAIVAVPALILIIVKGGPVAFGVLISTVCVISLYEYFRIVYNKTPVSVWSPLPFVAYGIGLSIIWAAFFKLFPVIVFAVIVNFLIVGLLTSMQFKNNPMVLDAVAKQVQGVSYIPLLMACLVFIRGDGPEGINWIFLLLILVFSGDTGAFYAGSYLGRHKLCPAVSPGKTWEGFVGGILANLIVGSILKVTLLTQLPWVLSLVFFASLGVFAPFGDLFESVLKRVGEIKDSGSILPGHGGFLDRIDALLFASPVVFIFKEYIF